MRLDCSQSSAKQLNMIMGMQTHKHNQQSSSQIFRNIDSELQDQAQLIFFVVQPEGQKKQSASGSQGRISKDSGPSGWREKSKDSICYKTDLKEWPDSHSETEEWKQYFGSQQAQNGQSRHLLRQELNQELTFIFHSVMTWI